MKVSAVEVGQCVQVVCGVTLVCFWLPWGVSWLDHNVSRVTVLVAGWHVITIAMLGPSEISREM